MRLQISRDEDLYKVVIAFITLIFPNKSPKREVLGSYIGAYSFVPNKRHPPLIISWKFFHLDPPVYQFSKISILATVNF